MRSLSTKTEPAEREKQHAQPEERKVRTTDWSHTPYAHPHPQCVRRICFVGTGVNKPQRESGPDPVRVIPRKMCRPANFPSWTGGVAAP